MPRRLFACLSVLVGVVVLAFSAPASAQDRIWIQIEANPSLQQALDRARAYEGMFDNLAGFRLPSGWYALALGPYADRGVADDIRIDLRARGMIPSDSYLEDERVFGQAYWPQGRSDPRQQAGTTAAGRGAELSSAGSVASPQPPAPQAAPEPAAQQPVPQPAPQAAPALPEETLAEARASEGQLSREERELIQMALAWDGYYTLGIDGAFGPGTRRAMSEYQAAMGFEETGVLTTRQRTELVEQYQAELAAIGMQSHRDDRAGIEIELPFGLVAFDRVDAPFVHFSPRGAAQVRAYLISQSGDRAALGALYEIMQSLEIVPTEGARSLQANGFTLTGQGDNLRSHTVVSLANGQIKGWTLVWTPAEDAVMARVLPMVDASFRRIPGVLPDSAVTGASAVSGVDLVAGLQVRRPVRAATGFFVDDEGRVLTSLATVDGCGRITLDERIDADLRLADAGLGVALLHPRSPLAPIGTAELARDLPRVAAEVAVAGFAHADLLTRPIVTFGSLAGLQGLDGEADLRRLSIATRAGDTGGPVFDTSGAVVGMLLPRPGGGQRILPEDVQFALGSEALGRVLERAGLHPRHASAGATPATPEALARRAVQMTVLVSCWES